jgi:hypothetical protein
MNRRSSTIKRFPGINYLPTTTPADWCNDRVDPQIPMASRLGWASDSTP